MPHRILRFALLVPACLASTACEMLTAPGGESIGGSKPATNGYQIGAYDWSSDARTISFTAATGDHNRAVGVFKLDVETGKTRTVASTVPGNSGMANSMEVVKPA